MQEIRSSPAYLIYFSCSHNNAGPSTEHLHHSVQVSLKSAHASPITGLEIFSFMARPSEVWAGPPCSVPRSAFPPPSVRANAALQAFLSFSFLTAHYGTFEMTTMTWLVSSSKELITIVRLKLLKVTSCLARFSITPEPVIGGMDSPNDAALLS
jgi:hypothetical protein